MPELKEKLKRLVLDPFANNQLMDYIRFLVQLSTANFMGMIYICIRNFINDVIIEMKNELVWSYLVKDSNFRSNLSALLKLYHRSFEECTVREGIIAYCIKELYVKSDSYAYDY